MTIWHELIPRLHIQDQPPPDSWRRCYEAKYALARLLRPASILEFGVRAGYSAFAFLSACPNGRYVGIDNNSDTHGGFSGAIEHARSLLSGFEATIHQQSSTEYMQEFREGDETQQTEQPNPFPSFELVHVDGDHSFHGCLGDLEAAVKFWPRAILVDDYWRIPEVHAACDRFAMKRATEFVRLVLDDSHNGATLFVPLYCAAASQLSTVAKQCDPK
ncbi:MAG: methyltransferase, cyclopropane fatty acid synthase [Planctomycetaceae bacterium]|nr:methyltransferase, cyclopropane fatty acid synthase [Planctomycetaceae bacterium]